MKTLQTPLLAQCHQARIKTNINLIHSFQLEIENLSTTLGLETKQNKQRKKQKSNENIRYQRHLVITRKYVVLNT